MNEFQSACLAVAFAFAVLTSSCAETQGGGLRPSAGQFSSNRVEIMMGGMIGLPEEGPALALQLKNSTSQPLWITVDFKTPDPAQQCRVTKRLDAGETHMYTCAQKSLTVDRDYPIVIAVFEDENRTRLLESPETKFWFGELDAAAFLSLMESMKSNK